MIERPPLLNLEQSSSRPSSLFSIDSAMSGTSGRNTWGGMEKQFGKPPPRFRRGGANVLAAGGIVMPKKREQVVRERERRMSTYAPENMDWEADAASYDPIVPRRSSSPPRLHEAGPLPAPTPTQPTEPDPPCAVQRSYSAPPAMTMSPPMIMITSDSMGSLTTETAHSAESFELNDFAQPAFASEAADNSSTIVESPVSHSAPPLPTESVPGVEEMVISQSLPATVREPAAGLEIDLGPLIAQAEPSHVNAPLEVISAQHMVPSASERSTLQGDKSRKRRSMSLTSVPSSRPAEAASTMPAAPASGSKVIRKHKSLKKFFFSSDNLAKQEQEPMPDLDRSHVKDNEARRKEEKTKSEKVDKADHADSERIAQARAKDDKKREMNKRSSLGGMLPRPKSKPSLRIDIKATKHMGSAAPSPGADSETSTPTPAPLTGSSAVTSSTSGGYPETPATSSSKSKGKAGTPAPESGGGTRGLTKRFSLSNMSNAFKRSKKDGAAVPQVPELPAAYKRDKAGRSMSADSATTPTTSAMRDIKHSAVPLSPKLQEAAIIDSPVSRSRPLLSPQNSPGSSMKGLPDPEPPSPGATSLRSVLSVSSDNSGHTLNAPGSPSHDDTSLLSDTSSTFELETELNHAQLVLVSPRTRRNPAESLQDILGVAPITRQSTVIKLDPILSRRSVEAIVLGPLLMSPSDMATLSEEDADDNEHSISGTAARDNNDRRGSGESTSSGHEADEGRPRHYGSASSLESLSRSSSTSDPLEHAPVTPSSVDCGPVLELPPPVPPKDDSLDVDLSAESSEDAVMVDAPSMQEIYDSPTSTITTSRRSPEGLFRFLSSGHSPKTTLKEVEISPKGKTKPLPPVASEPTGKKGNKGKAAGTMTFPLPPPPVPETKEYSSLHSDVQLRSLHFDSGLGLDFEFGFGAEELGGRDSRGLEAEVEVEVLA